MTFRAHHLLVTFDEEASVCIPCGLTAGFGARTIILVDLRPCSWGLGRGVWPHDNWRDRLGFDAPIFRYFRVGPVEVRRMRWAHR